jgi:hypothetical protein
VATVAEHGAAPDAGGCAAVAGELSDVRRLRSIMAATTIGAAVRGTRFWVGFAVLFLLMGVVLPLVTVLTVFAHGLALSQGTSPAWLFLIYPGVLSFLVLVRLTDSGPVPRGMLYGALSGTVLFAGALAWSITSAHR